MTNLPRFDSVSLYITVEFTPKVAHFREKRHNMKIYYQQQI
jgi:hypothetical protein